MVKNKLPLSILIINSILLLISIIYFIGFLISSVNSGIPALSLDLIISFLIMGSLFILSVLVFFKFNFARIIFGILFVIEFFIVIIGLFIGDYFLIQGEYKFITIPICLVVVYVYLFNKSVNEYFKKS